MAFVDAYGIADCGAEALATGNMTYGAGGLAEVNSEANGWGNLTIGASGLADCAVEALGQFVSLVKVASVVPISSTRVRFTFDRRMLKDAALLAAFNYGIVPITAGAVQVTVNEVEAENAINPLWVDCLTSEMTDSATYDGSVSPTGPTDTEGTNVDPGNNSAQYAGIGDSPVVSQVVPQSENRVDVIFNEAMKSNPDILNPTRYTWDNGLTTLSVLEVDGATVKLVTDDQVEGILYNLTVAP